MARLTKKDCLWLEGKFGDRVNFRPVERLLYGHDIAAIPGLFRPLIGSTTPDGIVQPQTEAELVDLVRWAAERKVPLVPRGKGSSGYGGVIPTRQGLVVDFYRMKDVLAVDPKDETVTVEPGITWEQLDFKLKPQGLTLRLYPTSYPSSTVGGWLAMGGAGIGSYEFGWLADNVISARVVLPSGEVRDLSGEDLKLVSEAEGTTGFITRVTLRVQKLADLVVKAVSFPEAGQLRKAFAQVIAHDVPLWSIVFINPCMAELKNKSPLRTHQGHPVEHRPDLPVAYVATLTFRKADEGRVMPVLGEIVKSQGGQFLSDAIAAHEWETRFKLMLVKRLGPSLVPSEVVVPLESLDAFLLDIGKKIDQPLVKEGVIVKKSRDGKPEAVILGFIPSDERKFSYNFVFGLVLSVLKIAARHGGRPYATGLYFTGQKGVVLGKERAAQLEKFHRSLPGREIMNPGKVYRSGLLGKVVGWASAFEPLIRPIGNRVSTKVGERFDLAKPVKGIPADVAWYAYGCSQCGYCVEECDQYYGRGWESQSPRGKWYWLRKFMEGKVKWDQFMVDTFLVCTTCELCNLRCSASLPIEPSWMKLRGKMIHEDHRMTFPPFEIMSAALQSQGDIWAGYRKNRWDWFPKEMEAKHGPGKKGKVVYFAGCTVSYVEHDMGQAAVNLLEAAGVDFVTLGNIENCCGTPMLVAGQWDVFEETMRKNIEAVKAAGADTVVTSCPACNMMWRHVYPEWAEKLGIEYGLKAKHYSELIAPKIKSGEFKFKKPIKARVTWHDSCHIGRVSGVYEEPREIIKAIPGVEFVEMAHHHEEAHCCGSVLTLIKEPPIAAEIGKIRLDEAAEIKADAVLALCPCCEFQLRVTQQKKNLPIEIHDLAAFACRSLGKEFADPNPEITRQWAAFEAMIALMTPKGFAGLMNTMWPELLKAMPLGMGGMMRFIGKLGPVGGGMLAMMKPLFPVLFPKLLPGMMPKVLPTMLERIKAVVPMPDYMAEQMPALMPKVMDKLMPQMLPAVVPEAVPGLIAFLRGKVA